MEKVKRQILIIPYPQGRDYLMSFPLLVLLFRNICLDPEKATPCLLHFSVIHSCGTLN